MMRIFLITGLLSGCAFTPNMASNPIGSTISLHERKDNLKCHKVALEDAERRYTHYQKQAMVSGKNCFLELNSFTDPLQCKKYE